MSIRTRKGAERYNDRMAAIWDNARRLERERLVRGEMPNPSLTSPEEALKYGWEINGREVKPLLKIALTAEQVIVVMQALRFALDLETCYYSLAPKGDTGRPTLDKEIDYEDGNAKLQAKRKKIAWELLCNTFGLDPEGKLTINR